MERISGNAEEQARRAAVSDLAAPRRIYKRKNRRGLILGFKIALPLIAIVGVVLVVIWSRINLGNTQINPVEVAADATKSTTGVSVTKVKYDGVDARNRPFTITAESASEPENSVGDTENQADTAGSKAPDPKASVINLSQLVADMTLVNGAWVAVTADNGIYNRDSGIIDLSGNVNLFHDTGLSFQTDAARIDMRNDTASGDQPVEGQRADGELASEGFEVRDDGQTVIFTGRAYLKLYPTPKAKPGTAASGGKG